MKRTTFETHDMFCGCGGSSQGVINASKKYGGNIEVSYAMNHWKLAVETHATNFPNTSHDCADVSNTDPRRYRSADLLIASPECTNHSLAKGVKRKYQATQTLFGELDIDPAAIRSRATMWDVPRFSEIHKYNAIIVENVVDARMWIMWDAWLMAMHNLGYMHKCVYYNSMHAHPTPQSRDRMYVVFWKKGNKSPDLDIRPKAWCSSCEKEVESIQSWKNPKKQYGKYKQQYVYRCPDCHINVEPYYYSAFNCIDWTIQGERIGDRKKPLADNTMTRIKFGMDKYGSQPTILYTDHTSILDRIHPTSASMFTQTTRQVAALFNPGFIAKQYGGGFNPKISHVAFDKGLGTITTSDHHGLVMMPQVITTRYTSGIASRVKGAYEVIPTQPGDPSHALLFSPYIVENFGCSTSKSIASVIGCQNTKDKYGLVSNEAINAFFTYYYGNSTPSGIYDPLSTVTTKDRAAIVLNPIQNVDINDCTYRMLKSHEIQAAMAFNKDYIVLGNSKEQVKQLGNAVTPPVMEDLIDRVIKTFL